MAHITLDTPTTIEPTDEVRECDFHGCHEPGEIPVCGLAVLCVVHWLRDRVRLNLASLAA